MGTKTCSIISSHDFSKLPCDVQESASCGEDVDFCYAVFLANQDGYCDVKFKAHPNPKYFVVPIICDIILETSAPKNRVYFNEDYIGTFSGCDFPNIKLDRLLGAIRIESDVKRMFIKGRVLSNQYRKEFDETSQLDENICPNALSKYNLKQYDGVITFANK
ncbi:MAG TPA: hypothetical protein VLE02_01190 [Nitrosarchaeum sp.]|nr:hypothetical protein [Nitrosarchaeum sp.]